MQLFFDDGKYIILNEGIDCSIPLSASEQNPRAWYVEQPVIEPVRGNGWVGAVAEGGSVNFRNIFFNPHGHGTHTECLGHITETVHSVNSVRLLPFYVAEVISIQPIEVMNADGLTDRIITRELLENAIQSQTVEALLVRTLPNTEHKKSFNYSDKNAPYFSVDCVDLLNQLGVIHFLVDTPSVDREKDNGVLAFHHAFWGVPANERFDRTITEMIYVPELTVDGTYLLNLQTAAFENDATPSRPIIFPIHFNTED